MNISSDDMAAFTNKNQTFPNISFVASCLVPANIGHGKIKYSFKNQNVLYDKITLLNGEFRNGTTAPVFCSEGYIVPSGEPNQTCVNGHWDLLEVTCTGN